MPLSLKRPFKNFGQPGNAAGVCEAAVCLWMKRICDNVAGFNWGSSAGDWVPTPANSNTLYNQFNDGTYLYTWMSYLEREVFLNARANPRGDNKTLAYTMGIDCCHFSGTIGQTPSVPDWTGLLERMQRGDMIFLSLSGGQGDSHAIGLYRGSDYIFVFDPNSGLWRGRGWTGCIRGHQLFDAATYLDVQCKKHGWNTRVYCGIHLRPR